MSSDSVRINGTPMVNVLGGKYVSRSNPLPVEVVGGNIGDGGGGSDISLPQDANGNVLMNLNAIGTDQSLGVNITGSSATLGVSLDKVTTTTSVPVSIKNTSIPVSGTVGLSGTPNINLSSVGSDVEVPVKWSGTPSFTLGGIGSSINTNNPIPTLDTGGYTLDEQQATFISGSGYNKAWNNASPGWNSLFTANNQRVRLLGVASEANQIFAFQKPQEFTIYFPCNVVIDLVGLITGQFNGAADQGFCSVVNSNSVGILLMYWLYQ